MTDYRNPANALSLLEVQAAKRGTAGFAKRIAATPVDGTASDITGQYTYTIDGVAASREAVIAKMGEIIEAAYAAGK